MASRAASIRAALERPPGALPVGDDLRRPPPGLVGERAKGLGGRLREAAHEVDQHVERRAPAGHGEGRSGSAAFEQQGVMVAVVRQEAHRALAVPGRQGVGLVLVLAPDERDLQDSLSPVRPPRRQHQRLEGVLERLTDLELPRCRARLDGAPQRPEPRPPVGVLS